VDKLKHYELDDEIERLSMQISNDGKNAYERA
jgi:hypothetical protein